MKPKGAIIMNWVGRTLKLTRRVNMKEPSMKNNPKLTRKGFAAMNGVGVSGAGSVGMKVGT